MVAQRFSHLLVENVEGVLVVKFKNGKMTDHDEVEDSGTQLFSLIQDGVKIIVNLENVTYLDDGLTGKLMCLHKRISNAKGVVIFCNINELVLERLALKKFTKLFTITKSIQEALQQITQNHVK